MSQLSPAELERRDRQIAGAWRACCKLALVGAGVVLVQVAALLWPGWFGS